MKNILKIILKLISNLIIALAIFMIFVQAIKRIDVYLKIRAIDDCAKISRYEQTDVKKNITAWYPIQDIYKSCLKDKGY